MGRRHDDHRENSESSSKGLTVRPFESLGELRREVRTTPKPPPRQKKGASSSIPVDPEFKESIVTPSTDDDAFAAAMADVVPLPDKGRVLKVQDPHVKQPRTADEAAEIEAYLRDLVDGVVPFDIADTDEYIEGAVQGFDRRVLRKLRRGEFSVQDHFDLHGHNREEARAAVAKFIKRAHAKGQRCVLVVHGRGLNSKDQIPVLKEKLKAWLTRGSLGSIVLAFSTARPYDGGAGAVYVLLRR